MTPELHTIIEAEADRLTWYLRGALERGDLISAGWLAYLTARPQPIGALRLRIRGAMKDALRREWRALGRMKQQILWPVYWPTTFHAPGIIGHQGKRKPYRVRRCLGCRVELDTTPGQESRKRCESCKIIHRRQYNAKYTHPKRKAA